MDEPKAIQSPADVRFKRLGRFAAWKVQRI